MSELLPDAAALAEAYRCARYGVEVDGDTFDLQVGASAADLEAYWPAPDYVLLTAWNPCSVPQPADANRVADEALRARLQAAAVPHLRAWASAPDGSWREDGWLLAGLGFARADALAREFGQAGVLAWRRGGPVRLRMLLPRPPGAAEEPSTEWVE
ncbi:MAG TPA: DUF3293 domain-containing protein [Lysobacter sp.]|nr:DUF3293 domain-containing protein [Lysobacter sp.]